MQEEKYLEIKNITKSHYDKIGKRRSPLFKEFVYFNSEGFNHLVYKSNRTERDKSVQIMKFKLLNKAIKLVELSTTVQEYDERMITVVQKMKKKRKNTSKIAKYWGVVAIIKEVKIKVIIRQVGNGQKHFWSVIPAWKKYNHENLKIIKTYCGDLKED